MAASWTHDEDSSNVLSKKDLPDVVLVRKVISSIYWGDGPGLIFYAAFYVPT